MNKNTLLKPIIFSTLIFLVVHIIFGTLNYLTDIYTASLNFSHSFPIREYLSSTAVYDLARYILTLIVCTGLFIYLSVLTAQKAHKYVKKELSLTTTASLTSLLASLSLISINRTYFPQSVYSLFDSSEWLTYAGMGFLSVIAIITILHHWKISLTATLLIAACSIYNPTNDKSKNNIIIVGIESLKPELISSHMPFLQDQLNNSILFPQTYTLFARTYPSWMTILTGRSPAHNGARFNLIPDKYLAEDNIYLPKKLNENGYYSIYASDERRFSNLNENHGFNEVIGPKTGANDFLLGRFSDIPILNTLSLTLAGKWLLPEIYANRAAHHIYYPEEFSQNLSNSIKTLPNKPIFMAVHFCLAHWPYTDAHPISEPDYTENPSYPNNLRKIDMQIKQLFADLDKKGILQDSKIIFISDHGESFGNVNTGIKSNKDGTELTIFEAGHGTNILNSQTHRVLLAFKNYHINPQPERLAILTDIFPTILKELSIPYDQTKIDGSPLQIIDTTPQVMAFESGITLSSMYETYKKIDNIANEGIDRFNVLQNGMLRVKDTAIPELKNNKQVGIRIGNNGLYMGKFLQNKECLLLIDHNKNTFSEITHIRDTAINPVLREEFCKTFSETKEIIKQMCNEINQQNHTP